MHAIGSAEALEHFGPIVGGSAIELSHNQEAHGIDALACITRKHPIEIKPELGIEEQNKNRRKHRKIQEKPTQDLGGKREPHGGKQDSRVTLHRD